MAVQTLKTTFKFKRGVSSVWKTLNPILDAGEPGFELDTHKLKIGDGLTHWNDLDYLNGSDESDLKESDFLFASKEQIEKLFKED